MVPATAIAKAMLSFRDVEEKLGLSRSANPQFFHEWQETLPGLTEAETVALNRLSSRYLRYLEEGEVSEGTLNIILLSPLLDVLGFCDPPYRLRGEVWVEVQVPID